MTLGADRLGKYPSIGNDVTLYPGAKIIGGIHIANGAVVGANSVVIGSVDEGEVVAGIPAAVIHSCRDATHNAGKNTRLAKT